MADQAARQNQYSYNATSNLVLRAVRTGPRASDEPSGEAESLWGRMMGKFGDRAHTGTPFEDDQTLKEKIQRKRANAELSSKAGSVGDKGAAAVAAARRSGLTGPSSVLDIEFSSGGGKAFSSGSNRVSSVSQQSSTYFPKTEETRVAFELLLGFLTGTSTGGVASSGRRRDIGGLGDQPFDVVRDAAEELLVIMKDDNVTTGVAPKDKHAAVQELLGPVSDDDFNRIVNMSKLITDFSVLQRNGINDALGDAGDDEDRVDEQHGVTVVFDDNSEDDEDFDVVKNDSSEDSEDDEFIVNATTVNGAVSGDADGGWATSVPGAGTQKVEGHVTVIGRGKSMSTRRSKAVVGSKVEDDKSDDDVEEDNMDPSSFDKNESSVGTTVSPLSIDAHWLQRLLSKDYGDAFECQQKADIVFNLLSKATDGHTSVHECENSLVSELNFNFDLIKTLLKNRVSIVWGTRLAVARISDNSDSKVEIVIQEIRSQCQAAEESSNPDSKELNAVYVAVIERKHGKRPAKSISSNNDMAPPSKRSLTNDQKAMDQSSDNAAPLSTVGLRNAKLLDLDSLAFESGSRTMTNTRCELPEGSFRAQKKGYEEVYVPARAPAPVATTERIIDIEDMPPWAQPAFKGMRRLNRIQSIVYDTALFSGENMLVCAPTGAGKTNIAVLAILNAIGPHVQAVEKASGGDAETTTVSIDLNAFKVVYVAPMKALVQEVVTNLGHRLKPFGINVRELSGDASLTKAQIADTQVIVTTPEKWDIITRKSACDRTYISLVRLMIVDEVHLLHDDRGAVIESLVARVLRQIEATQEMVRIVGLSATLPNYKDVGTFLRVKPDTGRFYFDSSYRPVPLQQLYVGINEKKALKRFQIMNQICYEKVVGHVTGTKVSNSDGDDAEMAAPTTGSGGHQVLVFVHTRKDTAATARAIRDLAMESGDGGAILDRFIREDYSREVLLQEIQSGSIKSPDLKEILPYGIGIHHAGMALSDRSLVEDLFREGHISVLVSTATLAWGVNLPAHAVIIKGTQIYNPDKGRWCELSSMDVMQMMGRAGRPQYDTFGEGTIITQHSQLQYYLSLLNQQLPIESQYIKRLADNLNAEVVLGTIQNAYEAITWLGYTYMYVRMLANPELYGISSDDTVNDPLLTQRRADMVHSAAVALHKAQLIKYDKRTGHFAVTDLGRAASQFYVTHESMSVFNSYLRPTMSDIELLRVFSLSSEFKYLVVRQEEKMELTRLLDRVPIPVKESIEEPTAKVNVLLQAFISRLRLDGFALSADMVYVTQSAARLLRCLFHIVLKRGWASLTRRALSFCKMVDRRMWLTQCPLRQFLSQSGAATASGLPADVIRKIEKKDFPWQRLIELSPEELGELVRIPKLGRSLYTAIHQFPCMDVSAHVEPITRSLLRIRLTLTPDFEWNDRVHGTSEPWWIFVEDGDGDNILYNDMFLLKSKYAKTQEDHTVSIVVPVTHPMPPQYFIRIVSDRWIGAETILPISFRHLILPEKFAPHTELLDLQPLPFSALKQPAIEDVIRSGILISQSLVSSSGDPLPYLHSLEALRIQSGSSSPWSTSLLVSPESLITHFNPIQTQTYSALYHSDDNVLVAAPTGSGKTICAEFAIARWLTNSSAENRGRCVYVAAKDDLAHARFEDWNSRFGYALGVRVVELTGETTADLKLLEKGQIIVSTPERWDMMSRRWKVRKHVQSVRLFIVDELHLVGGEAGPTLEIIVSRMRYMCSQLPDDARLRIVGLSSSVANANDLGEWIGASASRGNLFNFHSNVRPLPLEVHIQGFDISNYSNRFLAMARPCYQSIVRHCCSENDSSFISKPALVFVSTRKQARLLAMDLLTFASANDMPTRFLRVPASDIEPYIGKGMSDEVLVDCLRSGVGYIHESVTPNDRMIVEALYSSGAIQVVIVTCGLAWSLPVGLQVAHLVVIYGTETYEGHEHRYTDYPVADLMQMIGRAGRTIIDGSTVALLTESSSGTTMGGKVVVLCSSSKKDFLNRVLYEPVPVESHLDHRLADALNAEVVTKTIENKQDAVDYLTWTFLYRRLTLNPNYYALQGTSNRHLSDHLSTLIEETLADLEQSECVTIENELGVSPLNRGMIAAYYYLHYTTVELFASSIAANTKLRGILEIISAASEYRQLPIRHHEESLLSLLSSHLPIAIASTSATGKSVFSDPHAKTMILLQAHFSRRPLSADLMLDQSVVLSEAPRLLQAAVDVIASNGWLSPALAAMELCQMCVQGLWDNAPSLMQVPHVTQDIAVLGKSKYAVEGVLDILDMEDDQRTEFMTSAGWSVKQMADVARFCNAYPNIEISFIIEGSEESEGEVPSVSAGDSFTLVVKLDCEIDVDDEPPSGMASAPYFPKPKEEAWWLVVGDKKSNSLSSIKRTTLGSRPSVTTRLDITAPEQLGDHVYTLYLMSDSYLGADQEYAVSVRVVESKEEDEEEDSDN